MKLISHRGNLLGRFPEFENSPRYIDLAIETGFEVEIDLRIQFGKFFLGHDYPQYEIDANWLSCRKQHLLIHAKDFEALSWLSKSDFIYFFHEKEAYSVISNGLIWCHDITMLNNKCIIPLMTQEEITNFKRVDVKGVCSDYIQLKKT